LMALCLRALKLTCHKSRSNFAVNLNLRRYCEAGEAARAVGEELSVLNNLALWSLEVGALKVDPTKTKLRKRLELIKILTPVPGL